MSTDFIKLYNGILMPNMCFGTDIVYRYMYTNYTWKTRYKYWIKNFLKNRKQFKRDVSLPQIVDVAMQNGCNCFDTSRIYGGSEYLLGKTLKKYSREQYFVATKMCNRDQYTDNVKMALEKSLGELKLEYIDLYLLHWPVTDHYLKNWEKVIKAYEKGYCKAIGVCNCNIHHLEELKKAIGFMPMVNQFECHPLFTQVELRKYCHDNDIQVMAYTSTARMDSRLNNTQLVTIAQKHNKSMAQIILKWHQQIGNIPIVNSTNKNHFLENTKIRDFQLTQEEINIISSININSRLRYDPDNCDFTKL